MTVSTTPPLLLCAAIDNIDPWRQALVAAMPGDGVLVWPDVPDAADIRIALVAKPPRGALATLPKLELICSLWAGVDGLLADPTFPRHITLTRLIDPQLTASMVESVLLHVLSAHRLAPRYRSQQARVQWVQHEQPAAHERTVGILGFGELGRACAEALLPLGFRVVAWNRSGHTHPAVTVEHGTDGLERVLTRSNIAVSLLPATADTRGLLDARRLALLPTGATFINVGRGAVLDEAALLATLDSGRLEAAILDVFATEPLPAEHPFWRHAKVWVYPHVAAETDPRSAALIVSDTVRRFRAGLPLPERVDPARGY